MLTAAFPASAAPAPSFEAQAMFPAIRYACAPRRSANFASSPTPASPSRSSFCSAASAADESTANIAALPVPQVPTVTIAIAMASRVTV